jgi:hypothetical protein
MHEASVSEVARAILDHLRRNPEAQDTLEGIVQWWLPAQNVKSRTATIKHALDELVSAGLIAQCAGKDTQVSYRMTGDGPRNPEKALRKR